MRRSTGIIRGGTMPVANAASRDSHPTLSTRRSGRCRSVYVYSVRSGKYVNAPPSTYRTNDGQPPDRTDAQVSGFTPSTVERGSEGVRAEPSPDHDSGE